MTTITLTDSRTVKNAMLTPSVDTRTVASNAGAQHADRGDRWLPLAG
jgi:hypothetical protein